MAPVYHALSQSVLKPVVLHTGQHKDLAWPLYEFFGLTPTYALALSRKRPSLAHLSAILVDELDEVIEFIDPAAVLVHGDTSSALMAALTAFYHKCPVGHVEAGLRSHSALDPFPEEKNREVITRLARWHFAPTEGAVRNLVAEGIRTADIHCIGNTIVDAAAWGSRRLVSYFSRMSAVDSALTSEVVEFANDGRLVLVTAHRRENWDGAIARIAGGVRRVLEDHAELRVVWPVHPNPIVHDAVHGVLGDLRPELASRLFLAPPLNYPQMLWLLRNAWLVMTDSGGIQEEAAAMHVPVLVLRKTTERPELMEAGGGVLVGTRTDDITHWVDRLSLEPQVHRAMSDIENPFGDGHAATYLTGILIRELMGAHVRSITHAA